MTIAEFLKIAQRDFDTYDTVFDVEVTCCDMIHDKETDYYTRFCKFIYGKVEVVKMCGDCEMVCKWADFIGRNLEIFREAAREMWTWLPEDDDDLVYEWIKEINLWFAGYVSETEYRQFMENYAIKIK